MNGSASGVRMMAGGRALSDTPFSRAVAAIARPWWRMLLPTLLPTVVMGSIFLLVLQVPPGQQSVVEALECDKQVAILLTTHDPVDLQRASFLIRYLDCDIGRRLPRHE